MTNTTHLMALIDAMRDDGDLTTLLGGEFIYIAYRQQAFKIPAVIVTIVDTGQPRPAYDTLKVREHLAVVTLSIFIKSSQNTTEKVGERVDELLMATPLTDTWGWAKLSESETAWDDEMNTYQKVIRYNYRYQVTDT